METIEKKKLKDIQKNKPGYNRKPIMLGHDSFAYIQIFNKSKFYPEELWLSDMTWMHNSNQWEEAAEEFIEQLEGNECDYFLESLILHASALYSKNRLKADDKKGVEDLLVNLKKILE